MYGQMSYVFRFLCTRTGFVNLTYSSFIDGNTPVPLEQLNSEAKAPGSAYSLTDVKEKTVDGVKYTLTNVKINGTAVTPAVLAEIQQNNEISGKMSSNINIELLYTAKKEGES